MNLAIAIIGLVAAIAAAGAATGSWRAAARANRTADRLAAIELDRRRAELTPEFEITGVEGSGNDANLKVTLVGPHQLERLDAVTVRILDEKWQEHGNRLPPRVTEQEFAAFVWGPWEFNTNASVQIVDPRSSRPRAYSRANGKDWDLLPLRRTEPGSWMSATSFDAWRDQVARQPVRFLVSCRLGEHEWALPYEVSIESQTNT